MRRGLRKFLARFMSWYLTPILLFGGVLIFYPGDFEERLRCMLISMMSFQIGMFISVYGSILRNFLLKEDENDW